MLVERVPPGMSKLEDVSAERLREALAEVTDAKAAKRLMVALSYKDDESVEAMSERYGIPMATLYSWLDRFETKSIPEAIEDEQRPGRPPKLSADERESLREDLDQSPTAHGYDADDWTPELLQTHIETAYDTTYSVGHVRTLIRELSE